MLWTLFATTLAFAGHFESKTLDGFLTDVTNYVMRGRTIDFPDMEMDQWKLLLHVKAKVSQIKIHDVYIDFLEIDSNYTEVPSPEPYVQEKASVRIRLNGVRMNISAHLDATAPASISGGVIVTPASLDGSYVDISMDADLADHVVPMGVSSGQCRANMNLAMKFVGDCGLECSALGLIIPLLQSFISDQVSDILCNGDGNLLLPQFFPGVKAIINKDINNVVRTIYSTLRTPAKMGKANADLANFVASHVLPIKLPDASVQGIGVKEMTLKSLSFGSIIANQTGLINPLPPLLPTTARRRRDLQVGDADPIRTNFDISGLDGNMTFQLCGGVFGCEDVVMVMQGSKAVVDVTLQRDENGPIPVNPKATCTMGLHFTLSSPNGDFLFQEFLKSFSSVFGDFLGPLLCGAVDASIEQGGAEVLNILARIYGLIHNVPWSGF